MFKRPTRIMVVDDEKTFTEMLVLTLREMDHDAIMAFSGRECLDKLSESLIDVVILDIKMPGMDGIETLREIRNRFPLVEIIMLTGHGTIETSVKGMKLGAFDYLLKPPDFDELLRKVARARKRKDEQEERIRSAEGAALLKESRRGGRKPF